MTIGVLHRIGFGFGTVNAVIEIDGDDSRIVAETRWEGCSESPGQAGQEETRPPATDSGTDALWVGVASHEGTIAPIARVADGVWRIPPWTGAFYLESIAARKTGDGVWSWPDVNEIWESSAEDPDSPVRAPDVIATGVPGSWLLLRFDWLGFFRYDSLTFGVVQELAYESSGLTVVEIDGELGRVVARASEGGC